MQHNLNVKLIALLLVAITGSAYAQQDAYADSLNFDAEVFGTSIIFTWDVLPQNDPFTHYVLISESVDAQIQLNFDEAAFITDLYGASPGDTLEWVLEARDLNRRAPQGGSYVVASDSITVTIPGSGNSAPLVNAGNDVVALSNQEVILTGTVSDPNRDSVRETWSQVSGGSVHTEKAGDSLRVITPLVTTGERVLVFKLAASDGSLTTSDTVSITVQNSRPVADAGSDQILMNGTRITLDGRNSSDRDGPLTYLWEQQSGITVMFDTSRNRVSFDAPATATTPCIQVDDK